MTEPNRVIAEIRGYQEFTAALRQWIAELNTSYETIGELSGLQDGYLAKLLTTTPIRSFSRMSLGSTLGALGLKLLLVPDDAQLAAMRRRYVLKKHADDGMPRKKSHYLRGDSAFMRLLRHRGVLTLSARRRRQIAKHAAVIRWRRERAKGAESAL
jgi:hypothetical protein